MKILVVEDDSFFRNYFTTKLTENGFQVESAVDGEEALVKINAGKPDLILLDIIMPKKDGFEVLKSLTVDNLINTLPVIVFSTLGQEDDVKKALSLGARDYINKSLFDFNVILAKINQQLAPK